MSESEKNVVPPDNITAFTNLYKFPSNIESEEKLKTEELLKASASVVTLIESFGKVFSPVIYDMNGNIKKVTNKYEEDTENHTYIEDMILKAKKDGQLNVVESLQWLRRGLHFVSRFFQLILEDESGTDDLTICVKGAYQETLERYHGWLGVQLFNILSRFIQSRRSFIYTLALEKHNKEGLVLEDMRFFTQGMSAWVERLMEFYEIYELENHRRV